MATRTISVLGGNYNNIATWVEGVVPTSADDVIATATSGQLTVNVASVCQSIDFTNYVSTLTINNTLTVGAATSTARVVRLVAAMTITTTSGTPILLINSAATMTSNGKTFPYQLQFTGAFTATLIDNWTVTGTLTSLLSNRTLNGFTLTIGGGITLTGAIFGTTNLVMNGTGIWSGSGSVFNNLTFNTAGTITISGTVGYGGTGVLTYTAGTMILTGSTINIQSTPTFNTAGMTWNNFQIIATSTITLNSLLSAFQIRNGSVSTLTFAGAFGFTCTEFLSNANAASIVTLTIGNTYTVTTSLKVMLTQTFMTNVFLTITSNDVTTKAVFIYNGTAANLTMVCVNPTRIDSSGGNPIKFYKGTITDCINWKDVESVVALGYASM